MSAPSTSGGGMESYELLAQIGKGSFGKVYTARNYEDHELYVIKRIPFDAATRADADAALREAQFLALLRHPHIVPYKELFNFDGDLCLVMAHCEGGDLFQHVKQLRKAGKNVEEEKVWQWLVQLLLALSYCHSKKILHRDVKTQNVFMTRDGRLMLGDFGLAKQLQRTLEMARTPIGTPYYMAPEIYEEAPYSYKSDVWALGCVMYEVLTGRPAFAAENLSRVVIRVLKGTFDPLPSTFSPELREVVGSMLTREVSQRPAVNELLQHPCVLCKVQAYLDQLSSGGPKAGWNTWRMKLPPGILVQMANIISQSEKAGTRPASASSQHQQQQQQPQQQRPPSGRLPAGLPSRLEDLMTSEELIEGFGLQSLLEGHDRPSGGGRGGAAGACDPHAGPALAKSEARALLAATLHPEDQRQLALPGAQGPISEVQVLQSQLHAVRTNSGQPRLLADPNNAAHGAYWDHAPAANGGGAGAGGDVEYSGPGAQLLGVTGRTARARRATATGPDEAGGPGLEEVLSAGLPKAGFGFGAPVPVADVDTPRLKSAAKPLLPTSSLQRGGLRANGLPSPTAGGNDRRPAVVWRDYPEDEEPDEPAAAGNGNGNGGGGGWKNGGTATKSDLNLHDTLTNRAAFLRKELEAQLGKQRLAAAMDAVRALHDAAADAEDACGGGGGDDDDDDDALGEKALRAALKGVVASAAQLELAPLVDELVLLQERCYAD